MGSRTDLIVLAGPSCSGKTSLSKALAEELGAQIVTAREVLRDSGAIEERRDLQAFGAAIEKTTDGAWLASAVSRIANEGRPVVVDSARSRAQIDALRGLRQDAVVVYLAASFAARERRYAERDDEADRGRSFETLVSGELDEIVELPAEADVYVETDKKTRKEVAAEVLDVMRRLHEQD